MIFAQLLAFAILAFAVSDALKLKNCGKRLFQVIKSNVFWETLRKVNQNMTCQVVTFRFLSSSQVARDFSYILFQMYLFRNSTFNKELSY